MSGSAPQQPVVPSAAYDADYYLRSCAGAVQWAGSGGACFDPLYRGSLERARLGEGDVLVDLGTGRGELVGVAVEMGAASAIGFEYSSDAVALARSTLEQRSVGGRATVLAADIRALPLPAACADLVTMLDVVEHLAPAELNDALIEARRILRPGGRVFVHTMPNRLIYDVTYRLQRLGRPSRRRWPKDPRVDLERAMHVNEQSPASLRRTLRRAGFTGVVVELGAMVYDEFVPDEGARRTYHRLAGRRVTAQFGVADLWAEATAPRLSPCLGRGWRR